MSNHKRSNSIERKMNILKKVEEYTTLLVIVSVLKLMMTVSEIMIAGFTDTTPISFLVNSQIITIVLFLIRKRMGWFEEKRKNNDNKTTKKDRR